MKAIRVTDSMQNVAVDILNDLEILLMQTKGSVKSDDLFQVIEEAVEKYHLEKDPFTSMICSTKAYCISNEKFNEQLAEDLVDFL